MDGSATSAQGQGQEQAVLPRREGCVLLVDDHAWEDESELDPLSAPLPVEEWIAATRRAGYTVHWTPAAALAAGPYRGGTVVEVDDDASRSYVAVPPEVLERLQEVLSAQDYRLVCEDVANIDNPDGHGASVTPLDARAWEERRRVIPAGEPIPTQTWARTIREQHWRVAPPTGAPLPKDGLYPAGQVVTVEEAPGRRQYFAVPRVALGLASDLAAESAPAGGTEDAPGAGAGPGRDAPPDTAPPWSPVPGGGGEAFRVATVLYLDPAAWEERRQVVPQYEPIPTAVWAGKVRQEHMRVAVLEDAPLPDDSPCPGGRVVSVDDSGGRRYFAVPRAALGVAVDLARAGARESAAEGA